MEVKIDKNRKIIIEHSLKKNETYRINEGKNFKGVTIFKRTQLCYGYSSKTSNGLHVLLLDFDKTLKDVVYSDIANLTKRFNLSSFYLLTTGEKVLEECLNGQKTIIGNYHAVCLTVNSPKKTCEIMGYANIDENFRDSTLRKASKSWVLRLGNKKGSGKPKFLEIIGNENLDREISTAHKKLLTKFFPEIKHPKYINEDKLKKICLQIYETKN